ncbi:MAG: hypothetical protein WCC76_09940, partial [Candidatus Acidiferrales bacterium]
EALLPRINAGAPTEKQNGWSPNCALRIRETTWTYLKLRWLLPNGKASGVNYGSMALQAA